MMTLDAAMPQIATMLNAKLTPGDGIYTLDIPFAMPNGRTRYQNVFAWVDRPQNAPDCFHFESRVGLYDATKVNLHLLLREAMKNCFVTFAIADDKKKDGTPCETILVQARPYMHHIENIVHLKDIVWEVAIAADVMEEKFFGTDTF